MKILLNGRKIAERIKSEIKEELGNYGKKRPGLAVILVGDDGPSRTYVKLKQKACKEIGIKSEVHEFPKNVEERKVLAKVKELNRRKDVHGILIQLPLPKHLDERKLIDAILPEKDVDCLNAVNSGRFFLTGGEEGYAPCTPKGIVTLLKYHGIEIEGRDVVIVGRGKTVGKPLAILMLKENATVTICHTKTKNLKTHTKMADILIVAAGSPGLINAEMVKNGAVVVDVGNNRLADGKLCGDVDFENVSRKVHAISPVPGGVGPMTIAMLLRNTMDAFKGK